MSELARRTGVSIPTLKHYLREGLIRAARKTGRTMAWYDPQVVDRVRAIKELQRDRFLPLDVIRDALGRADRASDDLAAAEAIAEVLASHVGRRSRTRAELLERGVSARELDWLASAGLAVPSGPEARYSGDDLALLVTLGAARAAGLTDEMLPFSILGEYLDALRALVEIELRMFRAGVLARAKPGQARALARAATRLSERLVIVLRRKLLLPTLHRLMEESHAAHPVRPARRPGRVRHPRGTRHRRTRAR